MEIWTTEQVTDIRNCVCGVAIRADEIAFIQSGIYYHKYCSELERSEQEGSSYSVISHPIYAISEEKYMGLTDISVRNFISDEIIIPLEKRMLEFEVKKFALHRQKYDTINAQRAGESLVALDIPSISEEVKKVLGVQLEQLQRWRFVYDYIDIGVVEHMVCVELIITFLSSLTDAQKKNIGKKLDPLLKHIEESIHVAKSRNLKSEQDEQK